MSQAVSITGIETRAAGGWRLGLTIAVSFAALVAGCSKDEPKLNISAANMPAPLSAPERPPVPPAEKAAAEKQVIRAAMLAKVEAEPKDAEASLRAARLLRGEGRLNEALQIVARSAAVNTRDATLQREAGLLALDTGRLPDAEKHLRAALALGATDWQTRSALGAALASQGKHSEAQLHLAKALELKPDHPSILNNLALSYALDNKPEEAEKVLRIAAAAKEAPKHVRHNLALVLGMRGKSAEAERIATAASQPSAAPLNAAYVKALAAQRPADGTPVADARPAMPPAKQARAPGEIERPMLLGIGAPTPGN